ncbi:membrane protein insertase, YidC/Oxa1 family [Rubrobacter radiotolerans]|uniref:Membrane protein insertase YidC n=1 Tax=Rubrobacter radiotolerans TaxID=42256 RepID=A0A023X183_RUBRA|nr:membrane protein insertase YidC [Rubrobacter radiotolerans]AHY45780.1 membrane protein insertase, YidC/Oxa1 family [Rubrobacter radiotolerans]MDX5893195.1 membrane protein insertase YidC [Rubrobacter radiotolerans]SMC03243.1 YidC/Oxa1 family membrane protein insertase [Rubrobacter radiotolerans DSM 5868]
MFDTLLGFLRNLFDPLFDALGWLLLSFHDLGAPWWLSIVLLTVCVRTVLLPLTVRQTKSMRAMQVLRPEMDAIRERYKDEPQRMQQEMMKLYQERRVNPLGGCLPVLVQLPIFMVLYFTIKEFETLESFRTGGLFWFTDLTQADPYFLLPVIYVGTMMAAQEVTLRNTPMQAQQKMIMRFLPVVFGFFLAGFPAGLLVYWIASNIISFVQNVAIYRLYPVPDHTPKERSDSDAAGDGKPTADSQTGDRTVTRTGDRAGTNGRPTGKSGGTGSTFTPQKQTPQKSTKRRKKKKNRR